VHAQDSGANALLIDILEQVGITTDDALNLFDLLDLDASGEISFKEFKRGCSRILGVSDPLVDRYATNALLKNMRSDLFNFRKDFFREVETLLQRRRKRVDAAPWPPPPNPAHRPSTWQCSLLH